MEFIIHRINKIKDLKSLPKKFGVEIDIRTMGSKLILNHEPFNKVIFFIRCGDALYVFCN